MGCVGGGRCGNGSAIYVCGDVGGVDVKGCRGE